MRFCHKHHDAKLLSAAPNVHGVGRVKIASVAFSSLYPAGTPRAADMAHPIRLISGCGGPRMHTLITHIFAHINTHARDLVFST